MQALHCLKEQKHLLLFPKDKSVCSFPLSPFWVFKMTFSLAFSFFLDSISLSPGLLLSPLKATLPSHPSGDLQPPRLRPTHSFLLCLPTPPSQKPLSQRSPVTAHRQMQWPFLSLRPAWPFWVSHTVGHLFSTSLENPFLLPLPCSLLFFPYIWLRFLFSFLASLFSLYFFKYKLFSPQILFLLTTNASLWVTSKSRAKIKSCFATKILPCSSS